MKNPLEKTKRYFYEVNEELKKCSWPTLRNLYESTFVVIVACLILAFFVFIVDRIFQSII